MTAKQLSESFTQWIRDGQPLVLASVYATEGSTYSKTGDQMLIDEHGIFQGMLSGGCLEGDLAIRAQVVIESGRPQRVSYDLADDNDELWGLGVGCDGVMRIFLQPLDAANGYEPYATIANLRSGRDDAVAAMLIETSDDSVHTGAVCIVKGSISCELGLSGEPGLVVHEKAATLLTSKQTGIWTHDLRNGEIRVLYTHIVPVVRVLVLGAGLDAEPVVKFASELGWQCTVVDHRPAYINNNNFADAHKALCCPAEELSVTVAIDDFDFALVMSHHLASDRAYLKQIATADISYVGLLGPAGRRERLLKEMGDGVESLRPRLHGPAGLDIGGRGPAAIALSIVAEMQTALADMRT